MVEPPHKTCERAQNTVSDRILFSLSLSISYSQRYENRIDRNNNK